MSASTPPAGERILVDFFYAHPVGHAIEAIHHCLALHLADPSREIALVLNAATPTELAEWCPFISAVYAVDAPFLEAAPGAADSLAGIPRDWDWVLDDPRRHQPFQLELFAGMRDHYAASDAWFTAGVGRSIVGGPKLTRQRHAPLRLPVPGVARAAARRRLGESERPTVVVMPAGSSAPSGYPSGRSWERILDALARAVPNARIVLTGRLASDGERRPAPDAQSPGRTTTSVSRQELDRLLDHASAPFDAFGLPLDEQLAIVESARLFVAPHTGFGMAALAVGTPWLSIAGGRWFEWYFNHVPFRSVIPDQSRFPSYSQFEADQPLPDPDDPDGAERIPSMSAARVEADLPRIAKAARELVGGAVAYEQCLADYVRDLRAAHGGDPSLIWSFDGVHAEYL
jgi:hypothetical protein